MDKVNVVLGIPSYKGLHADALEGHYRFLHYLGRLQERSECTALVGNLPPGLTALDPEDPEADLNPGDPVFKFFTCPLTGCSLIGRARDIIITRALNCGADYVLFFDDDMIWPNSAFLKLFRAQVDIIGALAFTSREPIAPVLWKFNRTWNFRERRDDVDCQVMFDYPTDTLFRVDAIGTGFILIKAHVFKNLPHPWFNGSIAAGEDVHFCYKARRAGINIYCNSSAKTSHVRNDPQWMDEAYYLSKKEEAREFYRLNYGGANVSKFQAAL